VHYLAGPVTRDCFRALRNINAEITAKALRDVLNRRDNTRVGAV
ncbi:uncharacterized protein METZ01_LOCUS59141, partial [marine metagenome]